MDSELLAQHSLQPMAAQLITGGADQIEQIAAKAQDVGRIKGGFQISRGRRFGVIFEEFVFKQGFGRAEPVRAALIVFHEQLAIGAGFKRPTANNVGRLDDGIADDQQDIPGAVVVIAFGFPLHGADRVRMRPGVRSAHRDAAAHHHLDEAL